MRVAYALSSPPAGWFACDRGATVRYPPLLIEVSAPMILGSADATAGAPSEAEGQMPGPMPAPRIPAHVPPGQQASTGQQASSGQREAAARIEQAYPEYHVWISDAGWWYATRTHSWARGRSATVHGPGPGELAAALAAEEAATTGWAMTGAW
jgi:hypothetical protein